MESGQSANTSRHSGVYVQDVMIKYFIVFHREYFTGTPGEVELAAMALQIKFLHNCVAVER